MIPSAMFLYQHFNDHVSCLIGLVIITASIVIMFIYAIRTKTISPWLRIFRSFHCYPHICRRFVNNIYDSVMFRDKNKIHKELLRDILEHEYEYLNLRLIKKLRESSYLFLDFEKWLNMLHEKDVTQILQWTGLKVADSTDESISLHCEGIEVQDRNGNKITEIDFYIIIQLILDEVHKILNFFDLAHSDHLDDYFKIYEFKHWYLESLKQKRLDSCTENRASWLEERENDLLHKFKHHYDPFPADLRSQLKDKYWDRFKKMPSSFKRSMAYLSGAARLNYAAQNDVKCELPQTSCKDHVILKENEEKFAEEFGNYLDQQRESKATVVKVNYYTNGEYYFHSLSTRKKQVKASAKMSRQPSL